MENIFIGANSSKRGITADDVSPFKIFTSSQILFVINFKCFEFIYFYFKFRKPIWKMKKVYSDVTKLIPHCRCISLAKRVIRIYTTKNFINSWTICKRKCLNWSFMNFPKATLQSLKLILPKFYFDTLTWYETEDFGVKF